jgi:hypothetical protein
MAWNRNRPHGLIPDRMTMMMMMIIKSEEASVCSFLFHWLDLSVVGFVQKKHKVGTSDTLYFCRAARSVSLLFAYRPTALPIQWKVPWTGVSTCRDLKSVTTETPVFNKNGLEKLEPRYWNRAEWVRARPTVLHLVVLGLIFVGWFYLNPLSYST